jgi:hypothetical protein
MAIGVILTFTVSVTTGHGPLFVELKVNVTNPALISPAVIPYEVFIEVLLGLNAPAPLALQIPVVVPPLTFPVKGTLPALEHKVRFGPAFTVASCLILMATVS